MGHPLACAVAANVSPNEAVIGAARSRMACAASPANMARARPVSNRWRASTVAGQSARNPK